MRIDLEKISIVVVLRMARAAVGWSQEELAQRLGVAKTTIARIETGEGALSAMQYFQIERIYNEEGLSLSMLKGDKVSVSVNETALEKAQQRLADAGLKRSDRKKPVAALSNGMPKQGKSNKNNDQK